VEELEARRERKKNTMRYFNREGSAKASFVTDWLPISLVK
jgi:hypothetical protein